MARSRTEHDSLGPVRVPAEAFWGAQTQRAVEAYAISGQRMPRRFIWALGLVKRSCAEANEALELLDTARAEWIATAAQEVMDGRWDDHFPVDVFQTGSGTASNMNANEVIANRAIEMMGGTVGTRTPVHPNDHVNLGQSSNDVVPTALHVAVASELHDALIPALAHLHRALSKKSEAWSEVVKSGRTHLMDATPLTLGQEVGGWARQVALSIKRAETARDALLELALGGTAVGTGLNRHPDLPRRAIELIGDEAGLPFVEAACHFEAQGARDAAVACSGLVRTIAVSLAKIAGDVRLLASGPRTGIGELTLPALAPGSSIMPGKVNPVMCEVVVQVAAQVVGHDAAVTQGGLGGQLQLNAMVPLIAHNLLSSITLLERAARAFADKAIDGMRANEARCRDTVEDNLSIGTCLVPDLGYDRVAAIAKAAEASGRSFREQASADGVDPALLEAKLDALSLTRPG